ncbi:RagB/SusD family nutrient uptake outer membrane protein [Winogradskyella immobilis]|uniref:RagB/SusD family nutrient uptake outer membrane protein n=1 Tax=Winogradskyella immobilis TaxID=2816852 RepID=A0ABS8EM93_9FLAO|nr:RagB/SusD family nutrient uptake outer membrane protein [Winogradskyella immobilis]MCC1484345.1 RagB/SusD family nutrient uptake outer membrane protein [Winogradskyella immobilis]MCG0016437.1 RagB/SusD family nutrient uptake outer membrane protein [Winogradskyella immobilis]
MKKYIINKAYLKMLFATVLIFSLVSCSFDDQVDPNRPSLEGVLTGASINQLNNLVVGVESTMRNGIAIQTTGSGTMGRELYLFDADPRNTNDLLGANGAMLDNNSFYSTAPWAGRYRAIKNANLILDAIDNTTSITDQQRAGYSGFAKTIIAHELIDVLKSYNRARIDVADPDNLGPILDFDAALDQVIAMLEDGLSDLNSAGSDFAFSLAGFSGFDSPSTFAQFNRAVAATAYLYDGNAQATLTALNGSHFDLMGDLTTGPQHVFSLGSGDVTNDLFKITDNNGDQIIVHDSWIADAEAGDTRVTSKTSVRSNPTSQDMLNGTNQTELYPTNVSPIDLIRNEELILIYAEASILSNNLQDAEDALNVVRNAAGLPDYSGAQTAGDLTTEMLNQRRYSLWSENHRMFDLRRYNLNSTLPIDRPGDQVFDTLPVPLTENEGQ